MQTTTPNPIGPQSANPAASLPSRVRCRVTVENGRTWYAFNRAPAPEIRAELKRLGAQYYRGKGWALRVH